MFKNPENSRLIYKKLVDSDIQSLFDLLASQPTSDLEYFKPHRFDIQSLNVHLKNPSFLMMGAYDNGKMIGYFFLRLFANKTCFVGRLIDHNSRGKGVGKGMNFYMYEIAWRMGFKCLSTISRNNLAVMRAHSNNRNMLILKELKDDYLLVEFVRTDSGNNLKP